MPPSNPYLAAQICLCMCLSVCVCVDSFQQCFLKSALSWFATWPSQAFSSLLQRFRFYIPQILRRKQNKAKTKTGSRNA